jgi:hypothetical protein
MAFDVTVAIPRTVAPSYSTRLGISGLRSSFLTVNVIRRVKGEEELVAIGIGDPDHVVTPPRFLSRERALLDLTAKLIDPVPVQLDEQTAFVLASRIFTEDNFATSTIDLTDRPRAVAGVPFLSETQLVDVEAEGALNVGDEEHRSRVPVFGDSFAHG